MKTSCLMLVLLLTAPSFAADRLPSDAPTVFPPGDLAPGRSVPLTTGQAAPFPGQLLDEQEQVRRERMGRRDSAKAADLQKGNVTLSVPVAIAIVAGCIVAGTAAGFGISRATQPKP